MTKQQIMESVKELSQEQQWDLAYEIWELVDPKTIDLPSIKELKTELDRRLDEFERTAPATRPWSEIKKDIQQELRGAKQ